MDHHKPIQQHQVSLYVPGKRFTAMLWLHSVDDVEVRGIELETGEKLPGSSQRYASSDDAKEASRITVTAWMNTNMPG